MHDKFDQNGQVQNQLGLDFINHGESFKFITIAIELMLYFFLFANRICSRISLGMSSSLVCLITTHSRDASCVFLRVNEVYTAFKAARGGLDNSMTRLATVANTIKAGSRR